MPLPRTPKSNKKKKNTPKKEVPSKKEDTPTPEPPVPISEQLFQQKKKEEARKMEEQLKALVRQREAVAEKLDRVKAAIKSSEQVPNQNLKNQHFLKVHLKMVETCYGEYNSFQNQIYGLALTEDQEKQHRACYLKFEALHNTLLIQLHELIGNLTKPSAAFVPTAAMNVVATQYLPPLNVPLPTFDGTYETWYSFKSMFQSVMARYTAEAPAIKLYHLRNSLVGKAAGVMDQDIINNNDYDAAWAILEERFEDKRAIIDKHIDAVFALPKISRDNAAEFRMLTDSCVKHIEALKALQLPANGLGEQMLVNLLASRMDRDTRRAWEAQQTVGVLPTYDATIAFLKEKCRVLERVEPYDQPIDKPQRSVALVIAGRTKCSTCNQQHELKNCEQFLEKCVNERFRHLRKDGRCFNCLDKGHRAGECSLSNSCQRCCRRHHTLLHTDGAKKQRIQLKSSATDAPKRSNVNRLLPGRSSTFCAASKKQALLPTAVVQVFGENGEAHNCRVLIDSCSQKHFITEKFANLLEIEKRDVNCDISCLNGESTKINHQIRTRIKSRITSFSTELEFLITSRIIDEMPPETIDVSNWNLPPDIELADPNFNSRGQIDMLIGAEVFWNLIKAGKMTLAENLPMLRETELGWVVGGALPSRNSATVGVFCGVINNGTR